MMRKRLMWTLICILLVYDNFMQSRKAYEENTQNKSDPKLGPDACQNHWLVILFYRNLVALTPSTWRLYGSLARCLCHMKLWNWRGLNEKTLGPLRGLMIYPSWLPAYLPAWCLWNGSSTSAIVSN